MNIKTSDTYYVYAVILAFSMICVAIFNSVAVNSLWIDEWITLSNSSNVLGDPVRWIKFLCSNEDPHFPTTYIIEWALSNLPFYDNFRINYYVRIPMIISSLVVLLVTATQLIKNKGRQIGGGMTLIVLAALVCNPVWREHVAEARMYGLMSTLAVLMVVAVFCDSYLLAVGSGWVLAMLHPFGIVLGFSSTLGYLIVNDPKSRVYLKVGATSIIVAGVTMWWVWVKFRNGSHNFKAEGGDDQIYYVLSGIDYLYVIICSILSVCMFYMSLTNDRYFHKKNRLLYILTQQVSLALFILLLIYVKPQLIPVQRYVDWMNSYYHVLIMMLIFEFFNLNNIKPKYDFAISSLLLCFILFFCAQGSWGPKSGLGLHEAAAFVSDNIKTGEAVSYNTYEMFYFPKAYSKGYKCARGGESVLYLNYEARTSVLCQNKFEVVEIPQDVNRVYYIIEPLGWIGGRNTALKEFKILDEFKFGLTKVQIFDRVKSEFRLP